MKVRIFSTMLLAVLIPLAGQVASDTLPRSSQGIWSAGSCGNDDYTLLLGPDRVMIFNLENGGFGPLVGAAHYIRGAVVLFSENGASLLQLSDELRRCPELPRGLGEGYREEVAAFRVLYTPPDFGQEEDAILQGIADFQSEKESQDPRTARTMLWSARKRINDIANAKGELAELIWWRRDGPLGITIGTSDVVLLDRLRDLAQTITCEGAKLQSVSSKREIQDKLSTMGGSFCIWVDGVNDMGDPRSFTTEVDCVGTPSATKYCGIVFDAESDAPIIYDIEHGSPAQNAGLDWDQRVLAIGPLP